MHEHAPADGLQPGELVGAQHGVRHGGLGAHPVDDLALLGRCRVVDVDLHQKAVALGLGQRVDALALDRILCCQHEERIRHRVALPAEGDLPLCHHFEQRRLHLCRRPVDLIGQHEVGEDRPELGVEPLRARPVDARPDDVGRHQVGGELEARERAADRPRERLDGEGLGDAGHALEQAVAAREQADHHPLDEAFLADDDALDLEHDPLQRSGVGGGRASWFGHGVSDSLARKVKFAISRYGTNLYVARDAPIRRRPGRHATMLGQGLPQARYRGSDLAQSAAARRCTGQALAGL